VVCGVLQPKNSAEAGATPANVRGNAKTEATARTPNLVLFAAIAGSPKRLPQWLTVAYFGNAVNRLVPAGEAPTTLA
jgi:hypothetical protein